ncbi:MAG TPA: PQQ-binding-like beta-propeller repeat protein [Candidatus Sulfotelmatobacter sp.]|nr:PQQ-binding-like beta-propeller repeat protein [Candidatus Sulfotelmatobacter sp.]
MNSQRKVATVIMIVLFMTSITLLTIPVQAQAPTVNYTGGPLPAGVTPNATIETIPYLSVSPNPIGLNQPVLVNIWVQPATQVNRAHTGFSVTLTKPDGTTTTVGPMNSYCGDATAWFEYVVDQVGTWKVKFSFAGDYYPAGYYYNGFVYPSLAAIGPYTVSMFGGPIYLESAYYKPSSTADVELTVQADMVASWPPSALPTDYWTRPVSAMNREWASITGDYPYVGHMNNPPPKTNSYASNYKFTPYVQAPNSAHIVWQRQGAIAGIMGGDMGAKFYGAGEGSYTGVPSIIFEGRCYQTITKTAKVLINGTYYDQPTSVWQSYDLRTGEVYWEQTGINAPPTAIDYVRSGQVVPGASNSQVGTGAALVAISNGRLYKYNPYTGAVTLNISIAPITSGTIYSDPYVLSVQTIGSGANASYRLINWTLAGSDTNFTNRIMNNISYPFSSLGTTDYESGITVSTLSYTPSATGVATEVYIRAVSLTTGQLLWNVSSGVGYPLFSGSTACADHGKYAVRFDDGYWYCWDLASGKQLWKSEAESMPWGSFGAYTAASAYGLMFDFTYAGIYAIDWDTGKIAWHFSSPCAPFESPWYPEMDFFGAGPQIADGKLFVSNGEHSPTSPLARGWTFYCVNVTTGKGVWNISSRGNAGPMADGYLFMDSVYMGYMYVFGKGQSATTVTASPKTIANGAQVLIEGTVLDQSPAQPNTPCVSKDSMKTQMEYLHMQFPIDGTWHNVTMTGVPVTLTATDSANNVINIGTATTNAYSGTFSYTWTPSKEGVYTITASFTSDDSYGSSLASTAVAVCPAATVPDNTNNQQQITVPDYTMTILGVGIAVIIAVAIATVLLYRKK